MSAISDIKLHAVREMATTAPEAEFRSWVVLDIIERLRAVEWERDQLRIAMEDAGVGLKAEVIAEAARTAYEGEENIHWTTRRAVNAPA